VVQSADGGGVVSAGAGASLSCARVMPGAHARHKASAIVMRFMDRSCDDFNLSVNKRRHPTLQSRCSSPIALLEDFARAYGTNDDTPVGIPLRGETALSGVPGKFS
jgi:hypothetical protein